MKRTVRVALLSIGIAALVAPGFRPQTAALYPGNVILADGTQPPVPSGPMTHPANRRAAFDGTQPPVPSGPMQPPLA